MPASALSIRDPRRVREGLAIETYEEIKRELDLSDQQAATLLHLSPRTLGRRREDGHFQLDESDRIARLARLVNLALETFDGDEETVRMWFKSAHALLNDETPLDYTDTEIGARAVEDLLNALRYGFAA
jgi:putative toxin-antitoxin system antitoxin component (TIGR02293 family)